jgi:3alpha(or 20beta)-hydroxysteroid dehydrogenase
MARLDGKVAIVTGAARGTGEATARILAAEGALVVVGDINDDVGEAVTKTLGNASRYVHLDVTSEDDWSRAVETTVGEFGRVDVLVNNAGVLHLAALPDTALADYERVVRVNQTGVFLGMRAVSVPMIEARTGSIVNISSIDGLQGHTGAVAYCASKWAVRGMTRTAALELGRFGIRVNCVCPAGGGPEMIRPYVPEGIDMELIASYDVRRLASQRGRSIGERIDDIARMVAFLASDDAASCTGADFPVESGNTAGAITKGAPGA